MRNPSIELYRVGLMFGICLLHSITFGPYKCVWASNILESCVVGFVFISGWFGVKFSWRKLAKLYGIGLYAALVFGLLSWLIGDVDTFCGALMLGWHKLTHGFWFLHAYAFMIMLSSAINALICGGGGIYPLLCLVWIWGFGRTLPYGTEILPATAGLDSYGGVTLMAIYAAARWCSVNKIEKIKAGWLFAALPVLWFLTGIGLGDYNSPFAFALAGVMFLLFLKVKVPMLLCRSVSFLATSMFSVYLIHTNEVGERFIKYIETLVIANIFDCPAIAVFVSAIIVLICAILLDIPRRFCMARFIRN